MQGSPVNTLPRQYQSRYATLRSWECYTQGTAEETIKLGTGRTAEIWVTVPAGSMLVTSPSLVTSVTLMYKSQCRNMRNMKKQQNMALPNAHDSILESKYPEMLEILKNSKVWLLKWSMTSKRSQRKKQMNQLRKPIQVLDTKVCDRKEKSAGKLKLWINKKILKCCKWQSCWEG